MIKTVEGLREKLQNEDGSLTKEFKEGFYSYFNENNEIDVCTDSDEKMFLKSKGYELTWINVDNMCHYTDDIIEYIDSKVSTLDVQNTIDNLIGIEEDDLSELWDSIKCAFETTDKPIIIKSPYDDVDSFNGRDGIYGAFEDIENPPIINLEIEDGKIVDAWEA